MEDAGSESVLAAGPGHRSPNRGRAQMLRRRGSTRPNGSGRTTDDRDASRRTFLKTTAAATAGPFGSRFGREGPSAAAGSRSRQPKQPRAPRPPAPSSILILGGTGFASVAATKGVEYGHCIAECHELVTLFGPGPKHRFTHLFPRHGEARRGSGERPCSATRGAKLVMRWWTSSATNGLDPRWHAN